MARNDAYEKLCRYYEVMVGKIPNRKQFKSALQATLSEDEITVIFLLPFAGERNYEWLEKKAIKIGINPRRDWRRSFAS